MNRLMARAKRAIWTYRQPLTRIPQKAAAPVSDLFLWRKGTAWKTYFELTDMAGLYDAGADTAPAGSRRTSIRLFDAAGRPIGQHEVEAPRFRRQQVDISALAAQCSDDVGSFCVFHAETPSSVAQLGSHLAERGYVSYRYGDAPLRAYVHGNLDAISLGPDGGLEFLAGASLLEREYRLQHELAGAATYELAVVNPSAKPCEIRCDVRQATDGSKVETLTARLSPGGSHLFRIVPDGIAKRVVIRSHLVMARPLIFRIEDQKLDVLHG